MGEPDLTADEVVAQYRDGRRNFSGLFLEGLQLQGVTLEDAEFETSSLARTDFTGSNLVHVDFIDADLTEANLSQVSLVRAFLIGARLRGTNLRGASLADACLDDADCSNAGMDGAYFGGASLNETTLTGATFEDAVLTDTYFFEVDVAPLCVCSIDHEGPSSIDARTVMKSYKEPGLKAFMVDCGVPELFADYMIECAKALGDDLLRELMQSTFISYGGPDEGFAERLNEALRAHDVVTYFFPKTARVGERLGNEMRRGIQDHDRVVLVCSRASLHRPGVLNEIQETLDREARDGGASYLIPVLLDDYLLTDEAKAHPLLARVAERVAADFRDLASFDEPLGRLLAVLRKKTPAP